MVGHGTVHSLNGLKPVYRGWACRPAGRSHQHRLAAAPRAIVETAPLRLDAETRLRIQYTPTRNCAQPSTGKPSLGPRLTIFTSAPAGNDIPPGRSLCAFQPESANESAPPPLSPFSCYREWPLSAASASKPMRPCRLARSINPSPGTTPGTSATPAFR